VATAQPARLERPRQERLVAVTQVTVLGIVVRLVVILVEAVGVWLTGSATLTVDAVATLFDVIASVILLAAMRYAAKPPDLGHPFGHGRAEPLAGFQLALMLVITGIWFGVDNIASMFQETDHPPIPGWTWLLPAGASVVLMFVTWRITETGRRTGSTALRAESTHFLVDTLTSLLTAATLLFASSLPDWTILLDHSGGVLLSLVMIISGGLALSENLHQLLDRVPQEEDFERVQQSALSVDGVLDVEKVRIQRAGPDAHVNIDIEVNPEISVADSHTIAQQVRARIQVDWPFVRDVVVHVEPHYADQSK
jgi:cation diffusion facilitator family transporter